MKKLFIFLSTIFLAVMTMTAWAQESPKLSYQAVLRDSQNKLVANTSVQVTLKVQNANCTQTYYTEPQITRTTNQNGLLTLTFGAANEDWNKVKWDDASLVIDATWIGGNIKDTVAMTAVPYAYYAANSGGLDSYLDSAATVRHIHDSIKNLKSNVRADWAVADDASEAFILHKPCIKDSVENYLKDNRFLTSDSSVIKTMQDDIDALQAATTDNITKNNLCSSIKDNCTNVALKNEANTFSGNNTFTGANDFTTGTTTVASGFTFGTTTAANCNNVAVNACDLLTVFDSLVKRMNDVELNLYKKIDSLKNILDEPIPCTVTRKNANEKGKGATGISSVKDHQDNWYKVVQIGTQCWMAENMRATTEPTAPDVSILQSSCSEASQTDPYAYYSLCNEDTAAKYGCLYNFAAVMNGHAPLTDNTKYRGICPEGWHVPTDAEWKTLEKCCMMEDDGVTPIKDQTLNSDGDSFRGKGAGKYTGGNDWKGASGTTVPGNYAYAERNSTGFSALPAGNRHSAELGYYADFWSASKTGDSVVEIYYRTFGYKEEGVKRNKCTKSTGFPLRCVRD